MKTFKDLKFENDYRSGWLPYDGTIKAVMKFDNGYSVEVGKGGHYHSSNDEYEVIIQKDGEKATNIVHWADLRYCNEEQVTEIMAKVQEQKKELSYHEKQREGFLPYLNKVKDLGFRVFVFDGKDWNFAYIVNAEGIVSYIQPYRYGGVRLVTQHHGKIDCGTGFVVKDMIMLSDVTESLIECSFMAIPPSFHGGGYTNIKKVTIEELQAKFGLRKMKLVEF